MSHALPGFAFGGYSDFYRSLFNSRGVFVAHLGFNRCLVFYQATWIFVGVSYFTRPCSVLEPPKLSKAW